MYFAFMLSEKQHFFIGTWSEKQRNRWGGNYIGSSVVTSISLWGPYITNKTFLVTQGCRVQEILSSQIEDTLQSTGSVSLQKRCCLTGNLRGWKRKACSLTWPQKTYNTVSDLTPQEGHLSGDNRFSPERTVVISLLLVHTLCSVYLTLVLGISKTKKKRAAVFLLPTDTN